MLSSDLQWYPQNTISTVSSEISSDKTTSWIICIQKYRNQHMKYSSCVTLLLAVEKGYDLK